MLINQCLYQEIPTLIGHLSVKEELKFISNLAASHAEDLVCDHLLLDFLNLQIGRGRHRFNNWLILGQLHPETLESI